MKVVGLISGGKDSLSSLWKCLQHGHEIVCVANLAPAVVGDEELDSFCFQTVGHRHVEAIADALGLPLVRGTIEKGTSNVTTLAYPSRPTDTTDEVERLYDLLALVKQRFPEVNAVASGAILSNYQRLRVESVCARLGLVSLAFLWQRDQDAYVEEICAAGFEARLVKVASMGLKINHLGKPLAALKDQLKMMSFCHSAGEGGEYETIVTDCPLYRKRLVMEDERPVEAEGCDPMAPVAHLLFSLRAEDKQEVGNERLLPVPQTMRDEAAWRGDKAIPGPALLEQRLWTSPDGLWRMVGSVAAEPHADAVEAALQAEGVVDLLPQAVFVHVHGAAIESFADVNKGYNRNFDANPPSRAFVETSSVGAGVLMDVLSFSGPKQTLHVQSISEWAPACIGPYAQATTVRSTVLHAGMLGFDPPSMTLESRSSRLETVAVQAARAIDSYRAVMPVVESSLAHVGFGVAYVLDCDDVKTVADVWRSTYPDRPYPALVVAQVSALPKHAAFELQLMSAVTGCAATSRVAGSIVLARLPDMAYAACTLPDIPAAIRELEGEEGCAVGHIKVFVAPSDIEAAASFAAGTLLPVTLLPSQGASVLHPDLPSPTTASVAVVWAAAPAPTSSQ